MTWSSRTIAPEERADLLDQFGTYPTRSRRGFISNIAHYGVYLVLIPMMGGGLLGRLLTLLGLPETPAFLAGVAIATITSPIIYFVRAGAERRAREDWERRKKATEAVDVLPAYTLELAKIWSVEAEPDWPAYLLRDIEGKYVILCTDILQFAKPGFARESLEVIVAPPERQHILGLRWSGGPIPLEAVELPMPHDEWPGDGDFTLVPSSAIPAEWLPVLNAA